MNAFLEYVNNAVDIIKRKAAEASMDIYAYPEDHISAYAAESGIDVMAEVDTYMSIKSITLMLENNREEDNIFQNIIIGINTDNTISSISCLQAYTDTNEMKEFNVDAEDNPLRIEEFFDSPSPYEDIRMPGYSIQSQFFDYIWEKALKINREQSEKDFDEEINEIALDSNKEQETNETEACNHDSEMDISSENIEASIDSDDEPSL